MRLASRVALPAETVTARGAGGITIRRARAEDTGLSDLLFASARQEFAMLAGSEAVARRALAELWGGHGHSASFEHAWTAEIDGEPAGMLLGYPSRERWGLHAGLVRRGLRHLPPARRGLLLGAVARMAWLTPAPPRDSMYVGAVAVAPAHRRRHVAWELGDRFQAEAVSRSLPRLAAHTGTRNMVARRGLERFGFRATAQRSGGYVLYVKELGAGVATIPAPVARAA
ncbi:MAG: GNAT family N-acetyltransferase [Solirubrobacteraceae bacterium]